MGYKHVKRHDFPKVSLELYLIRAMNKQNIYHRIYDFYQCMNNF